MNLNPVEILNTGVTGFAFIMLYLGYRLTSRVQAKILEKDASTFDDLQIFKEWKDLVRSHLTNTRYFLFFAALFFAGGLFLLAYQAESKIIFAVTPIETNDKPLVYHQSEQVCLDESGCKELHVKNEQNIRVSNDSIISELQRLRLKLESKELLQSQLVIKTTAISNESGFGLSKKGE